MTKKDSGSLKIHTTGQIANFYFLKQVNIKTVQPNNLVGTTFADSKKYVPQAIQVTYHFWLAGEIIKVS